MAVDIGADEFDAGTTTTPISATAVAIGVATVIKQVGKPIVQTANGVESVTKQVGKIVGATATGVIGLPKNILFAALVAVAVGSPGVTQGLQFGITAAVQAVGVATTTFLVTYQVLAAAAAVGVVTILKQIGKPISYIVAAGLFLVRHVTLSHKATAVGSTDMNSQSNFLSTATAVATGVASVNSDETYRRTHAASATGVATVSVLFIPETPAPAPSGDEQRSYVRTFLVNLGKYISRA